MGIRSSRCQRPSILKSPARSCNRTLPPVFARLHPTFESPVAAVVLLTMVMAAAPFFGRQTLVWLVDAGGFATVVAYLLVVVSFLRIRRHHPDLVRPYAVRRPRLIGGLAVVATGCFIVLYLPGNPSALVWPWEWTIVGFWGILGGLLALGLATRVSALGRQAQARLILGEYATQIEGTLRREHDTA